MNQDQIPSATEEPQSGSSSQPAGDSPVKKEPLQGEVRGFRVDREHESAINPLVWTFRLDRYNKSGLQLPSIPVEMRGASFEGFIHEGDTVMLYDSWQEGSLVHAKRVFNLTSGIEVKAIDRHDLFGSSLRSLFTSRSLLSFIFIGMLVVVSLICLAAICIMVLSALQFGGF
jgi:hypothetical protein